MISLSLRSTTRIRRFAALVADVDGRKTVVRKVARYLFIAELKPHFAALRG